LAGRAYRADHERLAALGYGAGGRIVVELASAGVPFKAVAAVHPALPDASAADWAGATGAFLLCTGSEDPLCTPDQVLTFSRALSDAGVDWRVNVYGRAKHAFWAQPVNPDGSPSGGTTHTTATVPGVGYHAAHTARMAGSARPVRRDPRGLARDGLSEHDNPDSLASYRNRLSSTP
jgi:dienelactone hydrolase